MLKKLHNIFLMKPKLKILSTPFQSMMLTNKRPLTTSSNTNKYQQIIERKINCVIIGHILCALDFRSNLKQKINLRLECYRSYYTSTYAPSSQGTTSVSVALCTEELQRKNNKIHVQLFAVFLNSIYDLSLSLI